VGDHQRTIVVNETQKQQPLASGEFSFGRIPAFDHWSRNCARHVNFSYNSDQSI
jgi:hypothetical protein